LDKIIDAKVKTILEKRLQDFGGDPKKSFVNLDENPIWLNKEKGISIKNVTITGVSNAVALHDKKDKFGNLILDKEGKTQPVDFVNTSNNHHVAIYRDSEGNLKENVVSFFEALARVNAGLTIIDKSLNKSEGWEFLFSLKQNEYFVFPNVKTGFNPIEVDLKDENNFHLIGPNLYRVQKFGSLLSGFWFRHHLETTVEVNSHLKGETYKVVQSANNLRGLVKVRLDHIGKIVQVGEY
jgi:CRISPR-associated endonuclease Csn1